MVHLWVAVWLEYSFLMCAVPLIFYAIQHYLSIVGSIILIPLILVPAMGGTPVSNPSTYSPLTCLCAYCALLVVWGRFIWLNFVVMLAGGHGQSCVKHAYGVRAVHSTAYVLWIKVAIDSGSVVCLPRPSTCHHLLPWLHKPSTRCKLHNLCSISV